MLHIGRANNRFVLVLAVAVLTILSGTTAGQASKKALLDLTLRPRAAEHRSMGVPGNQVSSLDTGAQPPSLQLGLAVDKAVTDSPSSAVIRLEISNHGRSIFDVPSCIDQVKAHGSGARGRRILAFYTTFYDPAMRVLDSDVVAEVTFASASRPSCSIPLAPGSTMVVVYRMRLPHSVLQVLAKAGTVHLRASLVETKLKDTSFFVESDTPAAQSDVVQLRDR